MRLTVRLVLMTMLAMSLLTAAYGYLAVSREERLLKELMRDDARALGQMLEENVLLVWNQSGHQGVVELVRRTSVRSERLGMRWVPVAESRELARASSLEALSPAGWGEVLSFERRDPRGIARLHTYYPIQLAPSEQAYLEFSESLEGIEQFKRNTILQLVALLGAFLACGGFVTLVGVRLVGRPLQELVEKTERIGQGDFSGPLELRGHAELSRLADALNRMCERLSESQRQLAAESAARLATLEQLRHADRLKTVGRLASGLAHELGTPLNVVAGRAELIAGGQLPGEDVAASARAIKQEADRMAAIIRQLLDFARRGSPQRTTMDLGAIARQVLDLLKPLAEKRGVTLQLVGDAQPLPARVDPGQIQQVLTNLIDNAIQAMPQGGPVTVEAGHCRAAPADGQPGASGDYLYLAVMDRGAGIDDADRDHIFEPFFTTKRVGEGTGLGLSVSFGIVQDHGGWIAVDSQPGQGSRFTVYLPRES
ncbi:MAG: HAMP domain-containing histidine kinase [Pirellulaceae bacterium]|nr:HAMP domain-containing histidine kinase [Pirellulaceae bacterium]